MAKGGVLKKSRYFIGWILFKTSSLIIGYLPLKLIHKISNLLGILGFYLAKKFRKVSLESLNIAFGDKLSDREKKKLIKATLKNFARLILENFAFFKRPHLIKKYVKVKGLENLREALGQRKGVIGLTAHFGNFPLLCVRLSSLGFKINVLARPMRDSRMDREVTNMRERFRVRTIYSYPKDTAVKNSLQALRRNELLIIQMDQNFGTGGVEVEFFGKKAATPRGPIVFALRANSPVVPMFIIRDKKNPLFQEIVIERPYYLKKDKDLQTAIFEYVQKFTNLTEDYIKRYPDHWSWMHKRWKSKATKRR